MPKIAALGGLSSRGFGEFAQQTAANYIEDVFSTYLYTGNGSTQTITNGIDLSGKGGLVWIKARSSAQSNVLYDTVRGVGSDLCSNNTSQALTYSAGYELTSFNASGFSLGTAFNYNPNLNGATYASWTFRKQPKFFDVVTFTATGSLQTISHSLASLPGMIIIKNMGTSSSTNDWIVYHRSLGTSQTLFLNLTLSAQSLSYINSVNSTTFNFNSYGDAIGNTFVAYLFAHNAGGFGADGSQNVISCGSFTTNGSGAATVNLGYEPQYILAKTSSEAGGWYIYDIMRGWTMTDDNALLANSSAAESTGVTFGNPTATGFSIDSGATNPGSTWIYMAIRRGPMRTPTSGTNVFIPITSSAAFGTNLTTNFVIDSQWRAFRTLNDGYNTTVDDRIRGVSTSTTGSGNFLSTSLTDSENTSFQTTKYWNNTGFQMPGYCSSSSNIFWSFARAPGFFDVVCSSASSNISHNLTVAPELIIQKSRNTSIDWYVNPGTVNSIYNFGSLNSSSGFTNAWGYSGTPIILANATTILSPAYSGGGSTSVFYLFASCPGVSKVGSYTGTGATQTISCGFTGGARYVLIKRTDSTGDWWAWDTARGMVSGTDPRTAYNSANGEQNANWVYTTTGGFQIVTSDATVNANGGSYIYLAIA